MQDDLWRVAEGGVGLEASYIRAYFNNNLGDDMFVLCLLRRYPGHSFVCECPPEKRVPFIKETNLRFDEGGMKIAFPFVRRLRAELKGRLAYGVYIRIGGSIFMEPIGGSGTKKPRPKWLYRMQNGNRYVLGANFGPCFTDSFYQRARASLEAHRDVCFRDSYSKASFKGLRGVRTAPDILFGYSYPPLKDGSGFAISIIDPERKQFVDKYAEDYYRGMADLCDLLVEAGQRVVLFSFCKEEGDEKALEIVCRRMKSSERVEMVKYDGDVDEVISRMNSCKYVIATRFHAMVVGFALKKVVLPVIYSQKQTNVLEDCGFRGSTWDVMGGEFPDSEELYARCIGNPILNDVESLARDSELHFAVLDEALKGERERERCRSRLLP